jgi:hypothetical protein
MNRSFRTLLAILLLAVPAAAAEWYVAPDGKEGNAGTKESPWDIISVMAGAQKSVAPGDTVWANGGTYKPGKDGFVVKVSGAEGKPVIIRQAPGERATLAMNYFGLSVRASDVWLWGFEVINPDLKREGDATTGLNVYEGNRAKLINLVVHDVDACGISMWSKAFDTEMYGCLDFHNGYQGATRGVCHGVYTQNDTGTKIISDNIVFNMFCLGLQVYGGGNAKVRNYIIEGNICFNNGALMRGREDKPVPYVDNINVSGGSAKEGIKVIDNYTYHTPSADFGYNRMGAEWDGDSKDIVVTGNYWMGGQDAVEFFYWKDAVCRNNTAYSKGKVVTSLLPRGADLTKYDWDKNTYYGSGLFRFDAAEEEINKKTKPFLNWDEWRQKTGLDKNSTFTPGEPKGVWTFVRANKYETGRANICIYNWDLKDSVDVDLAKSGLKTGDKFEIRDAQNFFGKPVVTGTYDGKEVSIPMKDLTLMMPVGKIPTPVTHTGPQFGAFVVLKQ